MKIPIRILEDVKNLETLDNLVNHLKVKVIGAVYKEQTNTYNVIIEDKEKDGNGK